MWQGLEYLVRVVLRGVAQQGGHSVWGREVVGSNPTTPTRSLYGEK